MIEIRPVSDLRNRFPEIEELVHKSGKPVYLTKNGHGSMVVMSIEVYSALKEKEEKLETIEKSRSEGHAGVESRSSAGQKSTDEIYRKLVNRISGK